MDVPELVLIKVFNNLPLYNQLAARQVCKQWQRLIDENLAHSARELVLFANDVLLALQLPVSQPEQLAHCEP